MPHVFCKTNHFHRALSWRVHPPTSLGVVNQIIPIMIHLGYDRRAIHDIVQYSRFLTELGVCDYFFVTRKASSIGLAAILVAMEQLDGQKYPNTTSHKLLEELRGVYPQELERIQEIKECKGRLLGLYIAGGYDQQRREIERGRSPDSVVVCSPEVDPSNISNSLDQKPVKSQRTC